MEVQTQRRRCSGDFVNTKIIVMLILLVGYTLLAPGQAWPVRAAEAPAKQAADVLLIYDSLAKGSARQGNVALLQRLLAVYGARVTVTSADRYVSGQIDGYRKVVVVVNEAGYPRNAAPGNGSIAGGAAGWEADWARYRGEWLLIGRPPSGGSPGLGDIRTAPAAGQVVYAGSLDGNNDYSLLELSAKLKQWLGISRAGSTYLLLKEVYPFSDLELLRSAADRLYEAGIPFMVSAVPVFVNTGYPAMKRYVQALRYVQARGGSIVVNAPDVQLAIGKADRTLHAKMKVFLEALAAGGVAPLAIAAENYWTYDREYAGAGLGFFDSAILFPDTEAAYMEQTSTSKPFASALFPVGPEFAERFLVSVEEQQNPPMDTAVTYSFWTNREAMEQALEQLRGYWVRFADFKQIPHQVKTDRYTIASSGGGITLNGKPLNLEDTGEAVSGDYTYVEEQKRSFVGFFQAQNLFFLMVIGVSLLTFGGFILIGRRLYRRKYFK